MAKLKIVFGLSPSDTTGDTRETDQNPPPENQPTPEPLQNDLRPLWRDGWKGRAASTRLDGCTQSAGVCHQVTTGTKYTRSQSLRTFCSKVVETNSLFVQIIAVEKQ